MTRASKRSIEKRLDRVEDTLGYEPGGTLLVIPQSAQQEELEPQPDGEITVTENAGEVDGRTITHERTVVPHHLPVCIRRQRGIRFITYRQVLLSWVLMPDEVLQREIELRREEDEPIPPIAKNYMDQYDHETKHRTTT